MVKVRISLAGIMEQLAYVARVNGPPDRWIGRRNSLVGSGVHGQWHHLEVQLRKGVARHFFFDQSTAA